MKVEVTTEEEEELLQEKDQDAVMLKCSTGQYFTPQATTLVHEDAKNTKQKSCMKL